MPPYPYVINYVTKIGNKEFNPPAPALIVELKWGARSESLLALIDTGADATFIPEGIVKNLNLRRITKRPALVRGLGKGYSYRYVVDISFSGFSSPKMPVLELPDPDLQFPIIGRDIMNRFIIKLDGPNQNFNYRNVIEQNP